MQRRTFISSLIASLIPTSVLAKLTPYDIRDEIKQSREFKLPSVLELRDILDQVAYNEPDKSDYTIESVHRHLIDTVRVVHSIPIGVVMKTTYKSRPISYDGVNLNSYSVTTQLSFYDPATKKYTIYTLLWVFREYVSLYDYKIICDEPNTQMLFK